MGLWRFVRRAKMRLWQGVLLIVMVKVVGIAIMYTSWTYTDFSYNRIHPASYKRRIANEQPSHQYDNFVVETESPQSSNDLKDRSTALHTAPQRSNGFKGGSTALPTVVDSTETVQTAATAAKSPVKQLNDSELACQFPLLDPWDTSIKDFIIHPKPINCTPRQPPFTHIDQRGYLVFNHTAIEALEKAKNDSINCYHTMFDRAAGNNDDGIKYEAETLVTSRETPILVTKDAVRVKCNFTNIEDPDYFLYDNLHGTIAGDANVNQFHEESDNRLSVLLLILESMSGPSVPRSMPETYKYLTDQMDFHFFKGYHKVHHNSVPNIISLVSGMRYWYPQRDMPDEFEGFNCSAQQWDGFPFIWKKFGAEGYVTLFNEDTPTWGTFHHYNCLGFEKKPTHHYMRPYWLQHDQMKKLHRRSDHYCFGSVPYPKVHLDMTRDLFYRYKGKLKFAYAMMCQPMHDGILTARLIDPHLKDFFQELNEGGLLDHTAVFIVGDHGPLTGDMRNTLTGLQEERMPVLGVHFPKWFKEKNPHVQRYLKVNEMRLTSHWDTHETMHDVLYSLYADAQRPLSTRGLSLIYNVPTNRTCKIAGIPDMYCTCAKMIAVKIDDYQVKMAAEMIIRNINDEMKSHGYYPQCSRLRLKEVLRAEEVNGQGESNGTSKEEMKLLRVTFKTEPNDGMFDGMVRVYRHNTMLIQSQLNQIGRLNLYGNQSCIIDRVFSKFCYCDPNNPVTTPLPLNG